MHKRAKINKRCVQLAVSDLAIYVNYNLLSQNLQEGGRGYGQRIVIVNDAMGALRAGSPDGTGVVVACGTGAAVGARHPDGRIWHSSFWQEVQGADELSLSALRAVYRAELESTRRPVSLHAF